MKSKKGKASFIVILFLIVSFLSLTSYTLDVMQGMLKNLDYVSTSIFSFLLPIKMLFIPLFVIYIIKNYYCLHLSKILFGFILLSVFVTLISTFFQGFSSLSIYAAIWIPCITYCTGQILGQQRCLDKYLQFIFVAIFVVVLLDYLFSSSVIYSVVDVNLNIVYIPLLCMLLAFLSDNKKINIVIFIIMIAVLLGSGKRAGLLALIGSFSIHIFISYFNRRNIKKVLLILLLGIFIIGIFQEPILAFFEENRTLNRFTNDSGDDYSSGRLEIYMVTLSMFFNSPISQYFLGHGFSAVEMDSPLHLSAHNDFIEVLYDYGLIGLVLYVILHYRLIIQLIRMYKYKQSNSYILLFIYMSFLTLAMISHMFNYPYFYLITIALGYMEGKNYVKIH